METEVEPRVGNHSQIVAHTIVLDPIIDVGGMAMPDRDLERSANAERLFLRDDLRHAAIGVATRDKRARQAGHGEKRVRRIALADQVPVQRLRALFERLGEVRRDKVDVVRQHERKALPLRPSERPQQRTSVSLIDDAQARHQMIEVPINDVLRDAEACEHAV